ncbi:MAG TPA: sugar phosphate isomerase/epimerase family protein [Bryobacteraceae bacterium]|jgi:sugar phosphate isomerase/epimerase|nr:sugar phosphate isomerase/epimerase family protein [Bryobacteraceae bacterium]
MNRRSFLQAGAAALSALPLLSAANQLDYPWKLGVITDEVDPDLARALSSFYPKYGLKWAEFRNVSLGGRSVYVYREATDAQLRDLRKQLDGAGVKLSVLDTAVYKITLPGTTPLGASANDLNPATGEYARQLDDLKRAADAAHILGTRKLRIFTFKRVAQPDAIFQRVVDDLGKAAAVAKAHDVILVIENEFDCNVATGTETARLFEALPDRTLMHNWDPGNCIEAGENPFPDAWNKLDHSRIAHMHLKDSSGHGWLPIGAGKIDFAGQFRALKQMHYSETLSLETHYRNAQKDPYTSSVESMDGLMRVLSQV